METTREPERLRGTPVRSRFQLGAVTRVLFAFALIFGFVTRIVTTSRLLEFTPDQARDGFRIITMWSGHWPTLGQEATPVWLGPTHGGEVGFSIPPLAYYAVFPFTVLGTDPRWQALPNAIFSFLTIPLVTLLTYRLLASVADRPRRFYAALAGLWWSLSFADIILNNKEWNPSAIPFFFFALVLLYASAVMPKSAQPRRLLLWSAYGADAAYLASLHGSTLAIIPIVFLGSLAVFCWQSRAAPGEWRYPALAVAIALLCATPYWIGEVQRGWTNTHAIVSVALTHAPNVPRLSARQRLKNVVLSYTQLGSQAYFVRSSHVWRVGLPFLLAVLFGFACMRGSRTMWRYLCVTWLLFAFATANAGPNGAAYLHYKLLLIVAPLLLALAILANLDAASWWARALKIGVAAGFILSLLFNLRIDLDYLGEKFGPHRLMSTSDMAQAFVRLPRGATLCVNAESTWTSALYIDRLQTRRALRFTSPCESGSYVIRPRYVGRGMGDLADFGPAALDYRAVPNPDPTDGLLHTAGGNTYDLMRVAAGRRYVLVQGIAQVPAVTAACFARVSSQRPPSLVMAPPVDSPLRWPSRAELGRTAQRVLDTLDYTCF